METTMTTPTTPTAPPRNDVVYPESDGQPIGETGFHVKATILLHDALAALLAGRVDVYIAVDLFLYYERGNPRANKAPRRHGHLRRRQPRAAHLQDLGGARRPRRHLRDLLRRDLRGGPARQARGLPRLGVAEYVLFDPLGDCLDPRLQGFRLEDGHTSR
jgi:hypothetical protein